MTPSREKLLWYAHRLAAMGPAEIAHRIVETAKRRHGRTLGGWRRYDVGPGPLPCLPVDEARFAALAGTLEPQWRSFWEIAREGRWHFLGTAWPVAAAPDAPSAAIWHRDPVTRRDWPRADYCFDIPFRHAPDMGDIKAVWELNRLQFLPPLAALARLRGDDAVRAWCLACMDSWIEANPPFQGVNWASGIELAIRATSLVLAISLLGPETVPAALARRLRTAFNAHAVWLARYPSLHSSANNHLVSEAAALYLLGSSMPDLPGAARYRDGGRRTLLGEVERQILPDGVGAEQSPTYTAFTLEWYLLALAIADAGGAPFPPALVDRLHDAARHLRWITDGAGAQPRIGDDDEGCVIRSGPERETHYVGSVMAALAAATNDPSVAPPVSEPHLRALFVGAASSPAEGPRGWRTFDAGGYSIFRQRMANRETMLVFDHGPLGYLSIAAHGHADALAVWLHVDGRPVLVDAGTYLYHSGGAARDYFRGTRAHNTLTLDDEDQSRIAGPFNWSDKARAWRLPAENARGEPCSVARHDGYRTRFGLVHQRRIAPDLPDGYTIADELAGTLKRPNAIARLRYALSPDLDATQTAPNRVDLAIGGQPLVSIETTRAADGTSVPLRLADMDISPQFGVRIAARCVLVECAATALLTSAIRTRIEIASAKR